MTDIEQIAEREAVFRLGHISGAPPDAEAVEFERKRRLGNSLFAYDTAARCPLKLNGWLKRLSYDPTKDLWSVPADLKGPVLRHTRNADLIGDIKPFGNVGVIYADMRDSVSIKDPRFPIFQYNRRKNAVNCVLWPLRRVHDIGSGNFFGSLPRETNPFERKRARIFWRGNLAGFSNFEGDVRNVRLLVDSFLDGEISEDLFKAHLDTVPRYRFVSMFADDPRVDAGFVMSGRHSHLAKVRLIAPYVRPPAERLDYVDNKYLIALSGTDVSTVFGWAPGADVLLFKEDYDYEVFFDCHFQEGKDYVKVRPDFSDVLELFEWAESNVAECREKIAHANALSAILAQPDFRKRANTAFFDLYKTRVLSR